MNIHFQLYKYNKLKQSGNNNVLAKEFNIIFGINKNSSSADKKEDSIIDTQWDFPEKIFSQLLGKS